ncbi:ultraviolet-B receptor UVR8 [Pelomyxa schiedti]|nr:ultraviolet-B receptor UVR8 [Pelomyxa schiedti]
MGDQENNDEISATNEDHETEEAGEEISGPVFDNAVVYVLPSEDRSFAEKNAVIAAIKSRGGTVTYALNNKVTHVIANRWLRWRVELPPGAEFVSEKYLMTGEEEPEPEPEPELDLDEIFGFLADEEEESAKPVPRGRKQASKSRTPQSSRSPPPAKSSKTPPPSRTPPSRTPTLRTSRVSRTPPPKSEADEEALFFSGFEAVEDMPDAKVPGDRTTTEPPPTTSGGPDTTNPQVSGEDAARQLEKQGADLRQQMLAEDEAEASDSEDSELEDIEEESDTECGGTKFAPSSTLFPVTLENEMDFSPTYPAYEPESFPDTLEQLPLPERSEFDRIDPQKPPPKIYSLQCITSMEFYSQQSFEELRWSHFASMEYYTSICGTRGKYDLEKAPPKYMRLRGLSEMHGKGSLWGWGGNDCGQVGTGNKQPVAEPIFIQILRDQLISIIACGRHHTLALTDHGEIFSWGQGNAGQLGHGNTVDRLTPTPIEFFRGCPVHMIACGNGHSMALDHNSEVYTWGSKDSGVLGCSQHVLDSSCPHKLSSLYNKDVVFITAGGESSCALTGAGALFVWGSNLHGQLGLPNNDSNNSCYWFPVLCPGSSSLQLKYVSMGQHHSAGISILGDLYTWGYNAFGQLGLGHNDDCYTPTEVPYFYYKASKKIASPEVTHVSCGHYHTAIVSSSGKVFTCGQFSKSRLGHSDTDHCLMEPRQVKAISCTSVKQVTCGKQHTVAVTAAGNCWVWGTRQSFATSTTDRTCVPLDKSIHESFFEDTSDFKELVTEPMHVGPHFIRFLSGISMGFSFSLGSHSLVLIARKHTAIQHAKDGNVDEILRTIKDIDLLSYRKNRPPYDFSPLHWAAFLGRDQIAQTLIARNARRRVQQGNGTMVSGLEAKTRDGNTPLHICALRGKASITKMLMSANANPDIRNKDGNTALHVAILNDHMPCVEQLVYCDKTKRNKEGQTALHLAITKNTDMAEFLLSHAAPFDILDFESRHPLDLCTSKSTRERLRNIAQHREVFLSYAHADLKFATKLKEELERNCLCCWIDTTRLAAGSDWRSDIGNGVLGSSVLVYIISKTSSVSDWCIKELHLAKHQQIMICPIWYEKVDLMAEVKSLIYGVPIDDFSEPTQFKQSVSLLTKRLNTLLQRIRTLPDVLQPKMPRPSEMPYETMLSGGTPFLFIAHTHDDKGEYDTKAGCALMTQLLKNNVYTCMNQSGVSLFDNDYVTYQWREYHERLLENCSGLIILLSIRTLWDKETLRQLHIALAAKKKIYVVFTEENIFRLTAEQITAEAPLHRKVLNYDGTEQKTKTWHPRFKGKDPKKYPELRKSSFWVRLWEEREERRKQLKLERKAERWAERKLMLSKNRAKRAAEKKRSLDVNYGTTDSTRNTLSIPEQMIYDSKKALNLKDVLALYDKKLARADQKKRLDAARLAEYEREVREAEELAAAAGVAVESISHIDKRATLENLTWEQIKARKRAALAAANEHNPHGVLKELTTILADYPVFYLQRPECVRQLVYTIHMWDRDVVIAGHIAKLKAVLAAHEAALTAVQADLNAITSVYSFH